MADDNRRPLLCMLKTRKQPIRLAVPRTQTQGVGGVLNVSFDKKLLVLWVPNSNLFGQKPEHSGLQKKVVG